MEKCYLTINQLHEVNEGMRYVATSELKVVRLFEGKEIMNSLWCN